LGSAPWRGVVTNPAKFQSPTENMIMQTKIPSNAANYARNFPPFSLSRLLQTVFAPNGGERVCILIDLDDPSEAKDFAFLKNPDLTIQRHAFDAFYKELKNGVLAELGLEGGEMFAYQVTGGSNLDLPDEAVATDGRTVRLVEDVYKRYDIILCISTYSATAPLTAFAKHYGFRGATLHGVNQVILNSGLAVDYNEVSRLAEKLRLGMTRAESVEIVYVCENQTFTLSLALAGQEAQKSHGLCRGGPDVANLPAGEIYYVPAGAEGQFPMKYEDGTIGRMDVTKGRIRQATLLRGNQSTIDAHNEKLRSDPVTGEIGELGFGTQELPVSGRDIQDEKILGTLHVATGRSDHLGGPLTPDRFANKRNATHDDILFSPSKTPEINVPQVRMIRDGRTVVLIENYAPAAYMRELLAQ
jgi:aminopeptidase